VNTRILKNIFSIKPRQRFPKLLLLLFLKKSESAVQWSLDLNTAEDKSYTTHPRDWQQTDFIGMDRFISQLSPTHRAIVELIYIQGYTHEQAATMLHIPVGTVKSKLKIAITQLREKVL
jgi:RNA polymerase sigma factor (sigma-70 family)